MPDEPNWRPIPDPTALTTEAVNRLEKTVHERIASLRQLLEARIDGIQQIENERHRKNNEDWAAYQRQRMEGKRDAEAAVSAALLAASNAAEKSERAIKEQLLQLTNNANTVADSLRRSIDELKERTQADARIRGDRVTAVEQRIITLESQKQGAQSNTAWIAAIVTFVMLMLALLGWIASHNNPKIIVPEEAPGRATLDLFVMSA